MDLPRRVALRVPEYWPRIEVLLLALSADALLVADTFRYSRQSFQNRTRVRTPDGAHWLTVPLEGGGRGRPIDQTQVDPDSGWRGKHLRSLQHNYGTSAFYPHYHPGIRELLGQPWRCLGPLTVATVRWLLDAYRIDVPLITSSQFVPPPASAADMAPHLGDSVVVSLSDTAAADAGTFPRVEVLRVEERPRRQNFEGFVPGTSALDALFNYGPEAPAYLRGLLTGG